MLNVVSLIIGLVAMLFAAVAFIPGLGIFNWLIGGVAVIGAGVGAMSNASAGRNLNIVVILVCVLRLWLGGGLL